MIDLIVNLFKIYLSAGKTESVKLFGNCGIYTYITDDRLEDVLKKSWKIVTGALIVMMLLGFNQFLYGIATGQEQAYKSISAQQGLEIVETEKDVLMLDVRTPQEFTGPLGHIEGAKLIPVQELARRVAEIAQYKDKKVVLVCHSGRRSKIAGNILVQAGFKNVMEISTGMVGVRKLQTATAATTN